MLGWPLWQVRENSVLMGSLRHTIANVEIRNSWVRRIARHHQKGSAGHGIAGGSSTQFGVGQLDCTTRVVGGGQAAWADSARNTTAMMKAQHPVCFDFLTSSH